MPDYGEEDEYGDMGFDLDNYGEDFDFNDGFDDIFPDEQDLNIQSSSVYTPEEVLLLDCLYSDKVPIIAAIKENIKMVGVNSVKMIVTAQDHDDVPASK